MLTDILNSTFNSILDTTTGIVFSDALICTGVSLLLGVFIALVYRLHGNCSRNLIVSLVLLPAIVQMVIMMVNGNIGTGVAVMGAFSLVRFRSVPGSSKEICVIFFAMSVGLAMGVGFVTFAVTATVILCIALLLLAFIPIPDIKDKKKILKVTIPEDLDYTGVFDDIFKQYTSKVSLQRVKTTNLGSMFELDYYIVLKDLAKEKEMIDAIRCRNGNLTIVCGKMPTSNEEM